MDRFRDSFIGDKALLLVLVENQLAYIFISPLTQEPISDE